MMKQTITIYNRYEDEDTQKTKFNTTVIETAHWEATEGVQLAGMNLSDTSTVSVVIPFTMENYVTPSEYKGVGWTLAENDYIIKGIGTDITGFRDIDKIDEKMVISSYEINDYAITKRLNNYTASGK